MKGIVRDDEHNLIAGASVKIYGKVIKTSKRGEYWKLLLPGNYSIQVTAKGWEHLKTIIFMKKVVVYSQIY